MFLTSLPAPVEALFGGNGGDANPLDSKLSVLVTGDGGEVFVFAGPDQSVPIAVEYLYPGEVREIVIPTELRAGQ